MGADDNVLINFVGKTDELQPAENALDRIIAQAGEVGNAWKKTAETMGTATKQSTDGTNKLAQSIESMATATKSMDKAVIGGAYKNYLSQIQTQLGLTSKELIKYIQTARQAAQAAIISAGSDKEVKELTLSIEVMNEQLLELTKNSDGTGEGMTRLRTRLMDAKEQFAELLEKGIQSGPVFDEAKNKVEELAQQMRVVNETTKHLASEHKGLDAMLSLTTGVAGGFAVAQGTMALFGSQNEEVQKALLKVNAAMAILQGLQMIQNVLQKDSAASLFFANNQRVAAVATTEAQTVATEGAVVAQQELNTVMSLNPVGLIILGVTALITVLSIFDHQAENSAKAADNYANSLKNIGDGLKEINAFNASQGDKEIAGLQKKNALQSEIQKAQLNGLSKSLEAEMENARQVNALYSSFRDNAAAGNFTKEDFKKQNDEFFKQQQQSSQNIFKLRSDLSVAEINLAKQTNEEILQSNTSAAQAELARKKLVIINGQVDEIASIEAVNKAEINAIRARANEELKAKANTPGDKARIQAEANLAIAQKEKELQVRLLEIGKAGINARLILDQKGSEKEYEDKVALLHQEQAIELSATELTENQVKEIKAKYKKQELELTRQYEEQKIQNEISYLNSYLDEFGISEDRKLELTIRRIDRQRDLEISQAENNQAKIAEINAKFDKQIMEAKKASIQAALDQQLRSFDAFAHNAIAANGRILASDKYSYKEKLAASKDILTTELSRIDTEEQALKKQLDNKTISQKEYDVQVQELSNKRADAEIANEERVTAATLKEIDKKVASLRAVFGIFSKGLSAVLGTSGLGTAITEIENFTASAIKVFDQLKAGAINNIEAIKAIAEAAVQAAQQVVNQIFSDASAQRQQILSDEINDLETAKNKELSAKNLSEQQKADISERYRQKENEKKLQAWKADKEAKKSQALINAALAATLAFAEYVWPFNLIVAGITAGLAAVEIGQINSTSPPKFKHGRINIDGPGTETSDSIHAMISRGESVINAPATRKWQEALHAINTDSFENYMMAKAPGFIFPHLPGDLQGTGSGNGIDYVVLAQAVAREMAGIIPAPAQIHNTIDEHGLHSFVIRGSSKMEYKNKRYSMK